MAESKARGGRSWGLVLFGAIFFAAGSLFMWFMGLQPMVQSFASKSWPQVACTVVHSELIKNSSSDGTTYKPDIRVRHYFNDQEYTGGSYNFNTASSSGRKAKAKIVKQYPVGKQTWCWVNPNDPQQAVINRDIPGLVWIVIPFTSIFVLVGGAIMAGGLGMLPKSWSRSRKHSRVAASSVGQTVLKPSISSGGKILGIFLFAAIWNGVVSIFIVQLINDYNRGNTQWGLMLFLTPFVLIGIASIGFLIRSILALSNPKPIISLSEGSPKIGQKLTLEWQFEGRTDKINQLLITLEGCEKATYSVGTSSRTDTHVFYKKELLNVQVVDEFAKQNISFNIPEQTMHSFTSSNNKIEWALKLKGSIPYWADINEEYPIVVRPGGAL